MNKYKFTNKYLNRLAKTIDNILNINNEIVLRKFVKNYPEIIDKIGNAYGFYLLGNAWNGIRKINHEKNINKIWSLEQEEVFKEIYYLRKAIQQVNFKDLDLSIKLAIYVNLGNAFSHYGRTINAIKYFDKALALKIWNKDVINHPNYFMALINKGLALEYYSKLDYDDGHKELFIKFAYKNFKDAISIIDENLYKQYYEEEKYNVLLKLKWYEEKFDINELKDIDYFINYKTNFLENEYTYRKWCLEHKLFLNPLNDLGNYNITTHDPLNLPNLITRVDEGFPKTITNFNQLKQEFISYRHLLFDGSHEKTPKYFDKETSITNDYDYNLYDINIEKTKIAFRGLYSIFDKIAYFLNEYLILNMNENQIYFSNIWYEYKNRQKTGIKNIFNKSENLALRGLYLISKDLFDDKLHEFFEVLEPESQRLYDIRNHLEHKFISIKVFDSELLSIEDRKRNFNISQKELEQKTIHLAQLIREALIYLSFVVYIEENRKNIDKSLYVDMSLDYL